MLSFCQQLIHILHTPRHRFAQTLGWRKGERVIRGGLRKKGRRRKMMMRRMTRRKKKRGGEGNGEEEVVEWLNV